jgi:hypothetical protein
MWSAKYMFLVRYVRVCLELEKPHPDMVKIGRLMRFYFITTHRSASCRS